MNPIVLAAIIVMLVLFAGMLAAMSFVSFFADGERGRNGGSPTRGRPG